MLLSSIATLAALSEEAGAGATLGGTEGPDLTRYLVVSSVLLLGVAALAFAFRRLVGKNLVAKAARRSLQVMDVLPVGSRQRLAVVRCYDRTFLLGLGERELSLITELDAVIAPEAQALPGEADQRAFARLLQRAHLAPAPPRAPAPAQKAAAPAQRAPAQRTVADAGARRQTAEWLG
jgi:flagellar biogenesis protein FliO